jgi:enediyne biosynthesis protein E4
MQSRSSELWWTTFIVSLVLGCSEPQRETPGRTEEEAIPQASIQFEDQAVELGVEFEHLATRTPDKHMPEIVSAGVAVADFNRDGAPDIYLVGGGDLANAKRPQSGRDRLFLNDGGGRFHDASDQWKTEGGGYGMGVAVGDYDNDGWPDVFLTSHGDGERLYRNTGSFFEDVSESAGLDKDVGWSSSAGFLDGDGDGDLDVYVVRYVKFDPRVALKCHLNGRHTYCSPGLFEPEADTYLRNNGDGTFTDASVESGIGGDSCNGLALTLGDVDWDGDVDAFVANDITRNFLWLNDGKGKFVDRGSTAGIAYDETGRASAGMGGDYSDVDGNGLPDITCTNYQDETTNIYMQIAPGVFRDRAYALGVGSSAQQRLSFGVDFFDADNDGDEDLFVANGHIDDGVEAVSDSIGFPQQNSLYELEDGRFTEISNSSGRGLGLIEVTRGAVSADLDGDRRLDLVLTNNSGPARLLMNKSDVGAADAVVLWLEGKASNRSAIGSRVEAKVGDRVWRREVRGSSSYLSSCDPRVHLGLGDSPMLDELRILWPAGTTQVFSGIGPGFYRIVEGEEPEPFTPGEKTLPPR